jgi:hypothetical protein
MSAIAFDSFRLSRRLISAGFTEQQAEQIIDAAIEATTELVTKQDLRESLAELELHLVVKLGAGAAGIAGLLFAALKMTA